MPVMFIWQVNEEGILQRIVTKGKGNFGSVWAKNSHLDVAESNTGTIFNDLACWYYQFFVYRRQCGTVNAAMKKGSQR